MNRSSERTPSDLHIAVFGHYGHRNMGDEAIIEAVIQNLRARWPGVRISGFSMDADDTARRYGIPAYRIRQAPRTAPAPVAGAAAAEPAAPGGERAGGMRAYLKRIGPLRRLVHAGRFVFGLPGLLWREALFLRDSYRVARGIDCFIVAGSNQFLDNFGGVWGFPYTLFKWTLIARAVGARVVFVSVGAGPIDSLWSRVMVRATLLLADYVSFRDAGSRALMEWFGSGKRWRVYPDLAQSLEFQRTPPPNAAARPVVGINPMPVYDKRSWCAPDDARYERYVRELARFASRLLRERYPVFLFATQPSDEPVIDDVIARLDRDVPAPDRKPTSATVADTMAVIGAADIVVPTRYHGSVLSLHARRQVLGVCYYRKTREVLAAMGQGDCAIDIDDIDADELWRRFQTMVARRAAAIQELERHGAQVSALLAEQYDALLEIIAARTLPALAGARAR